jgi:hypothetical protein
VFNIRFLLYLHDVKLQLQWRPAHHCAKLYIRFPLRLRGMKLCI